MAKRHAPYQPDIQRVVLVHNHRPKTARLARRAAERLRGTGFFVSILQTEPGGPEANAEVLAKQLEPGDALGVVGGDGTYQDVGAGLLFPELDKLRGEVFITSMNEGGNACDGGTALHGWRTDPRKLFGSRMQAVAAYSLLCSIEAPDGTTQEHRALSYIGKGKTGLAAGWVNKTLYRKSPPVLRDVGIVAGTLASGHVFEIEDSDGTSTRLSELTVAKGPRMAKLARFPVFHWDEEMWVMSVPAGRLPTTRTAVQLPFGQAKGLHHHEPISFTAGTDIVSSFDGQPPIVIPAASYVEIGLAPESYNVLTTRLD